MKNITTYSVGDLVAELGQAHNFGVPKPFNGDPNYTPLDNWITNDNQVIHLLKVFIFINNTEHWYRNKVES